MYLLVKKHYDFPWQIKIHFNIIGEDFGLYIFLHNKDQMYVPKINRVFGSEFMYLKVDSALMKEKSNPGYYVHQNYKMTQTQYKALDTPLKRCTYDNKEANTTRCLTHFLEQRIGCSMGLARSDPKVARYHYNSYINILFSETHFLFQVQ